MSKEVFLLPSAKQILAYENGDIRSDEVSTVYRFHFLNTYIWIEPSKKGYDVKVRGKYSFDTPEVSFISSSRTIVTTWDLPAAVESFKGFVKNLILCHDIFLSADFSDFDWKV